MGIKGDLVRGVLSKNKSIKTQDFHVKNNYGVEKKRWRSSVRAYLCGDELFDSVVAEEDSASVRSSEATVTQTVLEDECSTDKIEDVRSQEDVKLEDAAATIIQSAFRGFMVRHQRARETTSLQNDEFVKGNESPSRESMATSIEVQTGNSTGVVSVQEEAPSLTTKAQHKPKRPVFKPKEDWDDSTVDSSMSKMRIQNRLEAITRRERALAYAFSQQLRICSKKKHTRSEATEPNMGWSWLERWMATRQVEVSSSELQMQTHMINKHAKEPITDIKTRPVLRKKFLDLSFEEKESCGSNEVPIQVGCSLNPTKDGKNGFKSHSRNRLKSPRSISRRKTVPTYHNQKDHDAKVNKRCGSREAEKDKRQKVKQLSGSCNNVCKDVASPDYSTFGLNSKSDP